MELKIGKVCFVVEGTNRLQCLKSKFQNSESGDEFFERMKKDVELLFGSLEFFHWEDTTTIQVPEV